MKLKHRILFSVFGAMLVSFGIALAAHLMSLNNWTESTGRVTGISFCDDKHYFDFEYEINGQIYKKQIEDDMRLYFRTTPLPHLGPMKFYYNASDPLIIRFDGECMSTVFVCCMVVLACLIALTGIDFYLDGNEDDMVGKKKAGVF